MGAVMKAAISWTHSVDMAPLGPPCLAPLRVVCGKDAERQNRDAYHHKGCASAGTT